MRELRAILKELPNYRSGPYADIRKWVRSQIEETRLRSGVTQRDSIAVRRQGAAQVALVGPPNGGGVLIQLVEIPGLLAGAAGDRAGGRALLGVLRGADAMVYCQDVNAPLRSLLQVRAEVAAAGIELPALLAATKVDDAAEGALGRLQAAMPDLSVVGVSILDGASLHALKEAIWQLVGLIRVCLRDQGEVGDEVLALQPGATVTDVAARIHRELGARFRAARVWGPSALFDGQLVGREHVVHDGDTVEIIP